MPSEGSYLGVDGDAVVTSVQLVGEGLEVRLFNPADSSTTATLRTCDHAMARSQYTRAQLVNLESSVVGDVLLVTEGQLELTLAPKQITTIRLS